jgi:type IV secretory pathway VirJ component
MQRIYPSVRRSGGLLAAAAAALLGLACGAPREEQIDAGRLGPARLLRPAGEPDAFVFLFSDAGGFTPELERAARTLAAGGAAVVGVDLAAYLRGLAASDDGCHYVVSELEDMSRRLQRELHVRRYRSPVLAGVGQGGTLAYAALAQSPAATVGAAVSIDPAPALATRVPLCSGAPAKPVAGGGFRYGAQPQLPGTWRVSTHAALDPGLAALAAPLAEASDAPPEERLVELTSALLREPGAKPAKLPIVEVPAAKPGPLFAVVYSGDGGWRDLDKQIAGELAAHGVPVVGVDSLRYFWHEKTPDRVARDLAEILRRYGERWQAKRALLVGYSFGACVLPFAVNRLPERERAQVALVSLLGLESRAVFEIEVSAWFGSRPGPEGTPVLPELERLDLSRLQCFYGEEEEDTLCPRPELARAEIVRTTGGHHFDGDYVALAKRILAGAERRATKAGP